MSLGAIASTIVYVVGTVLYAVLAGLVLRRKGKTGSDSMLMLLGLSAAIWYLGNAADRFTELLYAGRLALVVRVTDVMCALGIALVPSLLIIMALLYVNERGPRLPRWALGLAVAAVLAAPLPFVLALAQAIGGEVRLASITASPMGKVFLGWLAVALTASGAVCFWRRRHAAGEREQRFFHVLFWAVVAVALVFFGVPFFLAHRTGPAGRWLTSEIDLVISLGGLVPGLVFAYYVYRYNYLEYVLRRTIFHGFLSLLVICIYYFLIVQIARYLQQRAPRLNATLIEALMVIALVYLFPHLGRNLLEALRAIVFRRTADIEYMLGALNQRIGADSMVDPARLLGDVCAGIRSACGARDVGILLEEEHGMAAYGDRPPAGFGEDDFRAIVDLCTRKRSAWLERGDIADVACLEAMRKLGAYSIYPIVHEDACRGFIAVGRTPPMLPLPEEASDQLVVMAGRLAAALGRARMVQERLRLQRRLFAREKFATLGHLAASVAHEVRNPLSSIKALVQVLQEELEAEGRQVEEAGLVVEEINRLNRTVTRLLRYARPAPEGQRATDLPDVLGAVLQLLHHEADRRGVRMEVDLPEGLPALRAGEDEVKEILLNLVLNGLEAMPQGGTLTVRARAGDGPVRLAVSDTGPGIPQELLDRVFEPTFTTKSGGTGLGLSIVRDRVQQIGGSIRCTSSAEGTTMELEMPSAG